MARPLITPKVWASVVREHDAYWDKLLEEMRRYKLVYQCQFWDRASLRDYDLVVETSRGYEFIEGYIASLFARQPAVVAKGDTRGRGNARVAQGLSNAFLGKARPIIEDASRLALIYPSAAIKLAPEEHPDVYRRVKITAISPWDVIVDDKADSWATQRFVGHRYWVPLHEAKERWGNKDFRSVVRTDYIEKPQGKAIRQVQAPQDDLSAFIQVCEVYDLVGDRLLIWSPHFKNGDEWLDDGKDVEIAGVTQKFDRIPFRDVDDHPVLNIVPLYFSRLPDQPLRGYAAMRRVYDQIREKNLARTFQANAVRKCARQWLVKKGKFGNEEFAKIVQGVDGEAIEVELAPGESLADLMHPVPHAPMPPEVEAYNHQVDEDFGRGSVLAPFSRGEATKASASEVTALAAYSSSEIGRLARERDAAIEEVARVYTAMMALYLDGEGRDIVLMDGKPMVIKPDDLLGDFRFFAQDGGATPVSDAQKKLELMNAVPLLQQLGVPDPLILKEVVRMLDLPESFIPEAEALAKPMPPPTAPQPGGPTTPAPVPDTMLGLGPGSLPSPGKISQVLPS